MEVAKAATSPREAGATQSKPSSQRRYAYDAFATHATDPDGELVREVEAALEGYHRRTDLPSHLRVELEICVDGRDFVFSRGARSEEHPARFIETIVRNYQRQCRALLVFSGSMSREHPWVNDELRWWQEERPDGPVYFVLTHAPDPLRAEDFMPPALLERGGPDNQIFFDFRAFYRRDSWRSVLRRLMRQPTGREAKMRREAFEWSRVRRLEEEFTKLAALLVANATDLEIAVADLEEAYAAAERQRRRRKIAARAVVSVALVCAGGFGFVYYQMAEARRLESTSRALAIVADEAPRPDQQLLIALAALDAADTPEARGATMELLDRWSHLMRVEYVGSNVAALRASHGRGKILAGTFDGKLVSIASESTQGQENQHIPLGNGAATAVLPLDSGTLAGRWDGAVDRVGGSNETTEHLLPARQAAPHQDTRVLALSADPEGTVVAAGGADGSLRLVDAGTGDPLGSLDLSDRLRVNAIAFDPDAPRLMIGTGSLDLLLVDISNPRAPRLASTFPTRHLGEPLALGFDGEGLVTMFTKEGWFARYKLAGENVSIVDSTNMESGFISAATFGGAAEYLALGDAGGHVAVYDLFGFEQLARRRGHSAPVQALAFFDSARAIASGAGDGTIALWTLDSPEDLSLEHERPPGEILALAAESGGLLAAAGLIGPARLWSRTNGRWNEILDLEAATLRALGPHALDQPVHAPAADGFEPIDEPAIPYVSLAGTALAWTTRNGEVLWLPSREPGAVPQVLARRAASDAGPPALSRDGRITAWINDSAAAIGVFNADADAPGPAAPLLPSSARSLALDPAGHRLAVGLETGEVAIYLLGEREPESTRQIHGSAVQGLMFSEDGESLVSYASGGGGADRSVAIGSIPDLSDMMRLETRLPGGSATALAIGRVTDVLAVADHDGDVHLWSLSGRRPIGSLFAGGLWIPAIAINDAEQVLWVAGSDGRLLSWDLSRGGMTAIACRKANREISQSEWESLRPEDDYVTLCGEQLKEQSAVPHLR